MKRFKILIATILTLVAIITVTGVSYAAWIFNGKTEQSVSVDSGEWSSIDTNTDNLKYEEIYGADNHIAEYKVIGLKSEMVGSIIRIPSTHNDLPVTTIGSSFAEKERIQLYKLIIPSSVVTIEADALSYLNMLNTVVIDGNALTTIGDRAFNNCNSLKTIILPSSLTTVGINVLADCAKLTKIDVFAQKSKINKGGDIKGFGLKSDGTLPQIVFAKEAA